MTLVIIKIKKGQNLQEAPLFLTKNILIFDEFFSRFFSVFAF